MILWEIKAPEKEMSDTKVERYVGGHSLLATEDVTASI